MQTIASQVNWSYLLSCAYFFVFTVLRLLSYIDLGGNLSLKLEKAILIIQ